MTPPKRKRPKLKKINISSRSQWQNIIRDVDTDHIPIRLVNAIGINLIDGTKVTINIRELIAAGNDPEELDQVLRSKFASLDNIIQDVDFYVDIEAVANAVQPLTDQILKDL